MGCVSAATTPVVLSSGLVLTWDFDFGWDYFVICCVTLAASRWGGGGGLGVCAGWVVTPHTALLGVPVSFHSCTCLVGLHYRWLLAGSGGGVGVHSWGLSVFFFAFLLPPFFCTCVRLPHLACWDFARRRQVVCSMGDLLEMKQKEVLRTFFFV